MTRRVLLGTGITSLAVAGALSLSVSSADASSSAYVNPAWVRPGATIQLTGYGFKPNERVTVTLRPGAQFLATLRAGADGHTEAQLLIPTNTPTGRDTVALVGHSSHHRLFAMLRVDSGSVSHHRAAAGQSSSAGMASAASETRTSTAFGGAAAAIPLGAAGAAMTLAGGLTLMSVRHRRRPDLLQ